MSIEVERGAVASSQLDNYREQIRLKTKENRDLQVHIQGLTSQLKNVPYLQTKLTEFSDELQDYKVRVEKIPGLLAEVVLLKILYPILFMSVLRVMNSRLLQNIPYITKIARMRGSSRASVKALNDQDKTVATFKLRVKQLEKENSALKNDNRSLQVLL